MQLNYLLLMIILSNVQLKIAMPASSDTAFEVMYAIIK